VREMLEYILCFVAGMFIGWNFVPQPKFIENLYTKLVDKFSNNISDKNNNINDN
jgi:hypothetical protein